MKKYLMLALDHRNSFYKMVPVERAVEVKEKIIRAVKDEFEAVLLDKVYGLSAYKRIGCKKPYLLAIEKSGNRKEELKLGSRVKELVGMGAMGVKLLVYFDPETEQDKQKIEIAKKVYDDCQKEGVGLFLEIINYKERRVLESVKMFLKAGVKANVFKLEYPGSEEECGQISQELEKIPWILLSRGVKFLRFLDQVKKAVRNGADGFLVGRALWQDAVLKYMEGEEFDEQLVKSRFKKLKLAVERPKEEVIKEVEEWIKDKGLKWLYKEVRPWGGFWTMKGGDKILLIGPGEKLSWQYHKNRGEKWEVVWGKLGVLRSKGNKMPDESQMEVLLAGHKMEIEKEERHRLVGVGGWVLVAEEWVGESDEEDIVRLKDVYSR